MKLTDFKVLTFDCYGTLIDWESGMVEALKPLVAKVGRTLSRDEILEAHARHESAQQLTTPAKRYSELLAVVYKRLAEEWGVPVGVGRMRRLRPLGPRLAGLRRYRRGAPLSQAALQARDPVERRQRVLLVLQPQARRGVRRDLHRRGHRLLQALAAQFRIHAGEACRPAASRRSDILHTAESLFHDHAPANEFGLASCWIHRRHEQGGFGATMNPGKMPHTDFRFTSMAEMAEAHRKARAGAA